MFSKYFIVGVFLAGASLLAKSEPQSTPTIEERNKAIATRVFEEIFNQGRFEVADEIYSPDFQNHGYHRTVDLKTDQDAVHAEKQAFPDLRLQVERLIAEGGLGHGVMDLPWYPYCGRLWRPTRNRYTNRNEGDYDMAHSRRQDSGRVELFR